MKIRTLLLALFVLLLATTSRAEIAPEKRAEIDRMLKLTGMEKLMEQMMTQMIGSLKNSIKDVPPEYWDRCAAKFHASDMLEKLMPIYDKYYSLEDLKAVNAFYSSPTGQHVLKTLPQVMQEGMAVGQEWGRKLAEDTLRDAMAEKNPKAQ